MRRRVIAFVVLLTAVAAAAAGRGKAQHPLAGRDPAAGFVSAAYADARALVETGLSAELGNPDRLLAAGDPLRSRGSSSSTSSSSGRARRGTARRPPTPTAPLGAFLNADLSAILPLAAETLERLGDAFGGARALGLANLLDQVGALPAQTVG